jgi:hypothetical protein
MLELFTPAETGEPIPFILLRGLYDLLSDPVFVSFSIFDLFLTLGFLIYLVCGYYTLMKLQVAERAMGSAFLRLFVALVLLLLVPALRPGLYNLYFACYQATQGFYGEGLSEAIETMKSYAEESVGTTLASGSAYDYLSSGYQTGNAVTSTLSIGALLGRLNPLKAWSTSSLKALGRLGSGLSKVAIKNLAKVVIAFTSLFYIPYFVAALLLLFGICLLPFALGFYPLFNTGTLFVSKWFSTMLLTYLVVFFTPVIFAIATYTTIIVPITGALNTINNTVDDVLSNGGSFFEDDPDTSGGQELGDDILGATTAVVSVLSFPFNLIFSTLVLLVIGLITALYFIFRFESMLSGFIGGVVGTGLGWAGATVIADLPRPTPTPSNETVTTQETNVVPVRDIVGAPSRSPRSDA